MPWKVKIIFTFGILFVARPCNAINDILVTALPSALYIFNIKVKRWEGRRIFYSVFSQLDLDFSLRGVFTTWAVHVLGKNRDLGEEIIGKDPYLLGSVVTCEWMWPLRAQPALYEQLELLIWTWQESKEARGPGNYNRDLTRLRPNNRTSSI